MASLVINHDVVLELSGAVSSPATASDTSAVVRRPFDGLSVYEDTYAALIVQPSPGNALPLLNTSNEEQSTRSTANFIIQSISHSAQEKSQVTHTFSEDRVFFFGHTIDTLQVDAMLVENRTFQWLQEWYRNYKEAFSASAITEAKYDSKVLLRCEDRTYSGFITEMSTVRTAQDRHGVQLRFTMLVASVNFRRDLQTRGAVVDSTAATNALNVATQKLAALRRGAAFRGVASQSINELLFGTGTDFALVKLTESELLAYGARGTVEISAELKPYVEAYPSEFLIKRELREVPKDVKVINYLDGERFVSGATDMTQDDQAALNRLVRRINRDAAREAKITADKIALDRAALTSSSYVSSSTISVLQRLAVFGISSVAAAADGAVRGVATRRPGETIQDASLRGLKAATWQPVVDIKDTAVDMFESDHFTQALRA